VIIDRFAGDRQLPWVYGRYNQARIVSGRATVATSPRTLRPRDDQSRRAWLARRPRASVGLSAGKLAVDDGPANEAQAKPCCLACDQFITGNVHDG
jgi:hypothetical protein